MATEFKNQLTRTLANFLESIGLEIVPTTIAKETFLPGILIENGRMLVDEEKLTYPGDLLHEAGHLAAAHAEGIIHRWRRIGYRDDGRCGCRAGEVIEVRAPGAGRSDVVPGRTNYYPRSRDGHCAAELT